MVTIFLALAGIFAAIFMLGFAAGSNLPIVPDSLGRVLQISFFGAPVCLVLAGLAWVIG